ncbi:unnamed protein product [Adineta steineri]|uniref:Uncharacterized protein n=1 Tax=Adineta steineri TaxID=433720 RepID=A0A815GI12_9BILA|nr:unnamed protein product [Adineta steineri]CAF1592173.1 unnamed protein product [Adineta steineri]
MAESNRNSPFDEIDGLFSDEEFCQQIDAWFNDAILDNVSHTSPLNTAFVNETIVTEQSSLDLSSRIVTNTADDLHIMDLSTPSSSSSSKTIDLCSTDLSSNASRTTINPSVHLTPK